MCLYFPSRSGLFSWGEGLVMCKSPRQLHSGGLRAEVEPRSSRLKPSLAHFVAAQASVCG